MLQNGDTFSQKKCPLISGLLFIPTMLIEDWETVVELFPESSASAAGQLLWDSASIEELGQVFAICLLHPTLAFFIEACMVGWHESPDSVVISE